jgi:hypothetical protein
MTTNLIECIDSYRSLHLLPLTLNLAWDEDTKKKVATNFACPYATISDEASWKKHEPKIRDCSNKNAIALCCGRAGPNGIVMVDIDFSKVAKSKAVINGMHVWRRLTEEHGEPLTWKAKTQSGGLHYYFRADLPGLQRTGDATKLRVASLQTTIDYRGKGICFLQPAYFAMAICTLTAG